MKRQLIIVAICAVSIPSIANAIPDASEFKRVKASRSVALENCTVSGINDSLSVRFKLEDGRVNVSLPKSFKRLPLAVGTNKIRYVACGVSDEDSSKTVLFLKRTADAETATEKSLALSGFEKQGKLGSACTSIRSWPGAFIYKTIGSNHFPSSDPRRYSIGLVMRHGAGVPRPSCIDALATNGTKVGDLGFYAAGGEWYARYYGGHGCGDQISGSGLAARARQAAGSDSVYMRIGSTCYGPISASRCVGSSQC